MLSTLQWIFSLFMNEHLWICLVITQNFNRLAHTHISFEAERIWIVTCTQYEKAWAHKRAKIRIDMYNFHQLCGFQLAFYKPSKIAMNNSWKRYRAAKIACKRIKILLFELKWKLHKKFYEKLNVCGHWNALIEWGKDKLTSLVTKFVARFFLTSCSVCLLEYFDHLPTLFRTVAHFVVWPVCRLPKREFVCMFDRLPSELCK